jgi:threonine dehydratase
MPEKAGSLKELFLALNQGWNISLFHYRNHGSDYGRILIGIQIKDRTEEKMQHFFDKLRVAGSRECVEETDNPVSKYFFKI